MRYLRAGSLCEALARGPWTPDMALCLLDQIASALMAAHRQGVIHRDVKPMKTIGVSCRLDGKLPGSDAIAMKICPRLRLSPKQPTFSPTHEAKDKPSFSAYPIACCSPAPGEWSSSFASTAAIGKDAS